MGAEIREFRRKGFMGAENQRIQEKGVPWELKIREFRRMGAENQGNSGERVSWELKIRGIQEKWILWELKIREFRRKGFMAAEN